MPKLPRHRLKIGIEGDNRPVLMEARSGAHVCATCLNQIRFSDWVNTCQGCEFRVHYHAGCGVFMGDYYLCRACLGTD